MKENARYQEPIDCGNAYRNTYHQGLDALLQRLQAESVKRRADFTGSSISAQAAARKAQCGRRERSFTAPPAANAGMAPDRAGPGPALGQDAVRSL